MVKVDYVVFFVAGAAIILAIAACGLLAFLFFSSQPAPPSPQQNHTNTSFNSSNQSGNGSTISEQDFSLWLLIRKDNVESACLQKAREQAGSQAWGVNACTCKETITPETKSYKCDIDTADPTTRYFADIDCSLVSRNCRVVTNFGSQNVTFEQLGQWYG
ncbi:MAG: hypothetical protein U0R44_01335 [Candidatus Micrarchaeia archaeon]